MELRRALFDFTDQLRPTRKRRRVQVGPAGGGIGRIIEGFPSSQTTTQGLCQAITPEQHLTMATLAAGYHSVALGNAPGQAAFFRACSPDAHTGGAPGELKRWMQATMPAGGLTSDSAAPGVMTFQSHPPGSWSLVGVFPLVVELWLTTRDDHEPDSGRDRSSATTRAKSTPAPVYHVKGGLRDNLANTTRVATHTLEFAG